MSYHRLGCTSSQHKVMLRDITTDLIISERIVTTEVRTKEVRSAVEKMITLGKRGDLHARRQVAAFVRNEAVSVRGEDESIVIELALQKLFNDLEPRSTERQDGCTRILKTEPKRGNAAPVVVTELTK